MHIVKNLRGLLLLRKNVRFISASINSRYTQFLILVMMYTDIISKVCGSVNSINIYTDKHKALVCGAALFVFKMILYMCVCMCALTSPLTLCLDLCFYIKTK